MKFSIITAVFNCEKTILDCLKSVELQNYPEVEHIIVDGNSSDMTLQVIKEFVRKSTKYIYIVVSEPDKNLYDAMNKGIALATGDIIGILNADDFYPNENNLSEIMSCFNRSKAKIVIGDVNLVNESAPTKFIRQLTARGFTNNDFLKGECPPHPGVFCRREVYSKLGTFDIEQAVCADYDLMLRFLMLNKVSYTHLPKAVVHMRAGGISNRSLLDKIKFNRNKMQIIKKHGLKTSFFKVYSRYFRKAWNRVFT